MQSLFHALAATVIVSKLLTLNIPTTNYILLSQHSMSLDDRYPNAAVNQIFKDNILLTLNYMDGRIHNMGNIQWDIIEKPSTYMFILQPNQTFAFHDLVLPQYQNKITQTTNAHFNGAEGFKSDGYLFGDGVCHMASLMKWAAKDAKLDVLAPTPHDFAVIPEIARENGVAIYTEQGAVQASEEQNLYITNNQSYPISFDFAYDGKNLTVTVTEDK